MTENRPSKIFLTTCPRRRIYGEST